MNTTNISANHKAILSRSSVRVGDIDTFKTLQRAGFQPFIELTYKHGSSNKFYRVETQRGVTFRRWGRIGTQGQQKLLTGTSSQDIFWSKVRKGYTVSKPTGSFPVRIAEVRSNGDKMELLDVSGNIVWSDTPLSALKVLAVCSL